MTTPAEQYVNAYLNIPAWLAYADGGRVVRTWARNYLQSGKGEQSVRAQAAKSALFKGIAGLLGTSSTPDVFEVDSYRIARNSLERVYMGKGSPDEIQNALWLGSLADVVYVSTVTTYCDKNLGVDCGGFVANFWGMGKPSADKTTPEGWSGFLPRTFWDRFRVLRRSHWTEICNDDAVIFFKDIKADDPDVAKKRDGKGHLIAGTGSEAFHIGLVAFVAPVDFNDTINLTIAESSGGLASSSGNGVNVRTIPEVKTQVDARGWVYCVQGNSRLYFVGSPKGPDPYWPEYYAEA